MDRGYFWLDEAECWRLAPLLTTYTRGVPRVDDRRGPPCLGERRALCGGARDLWAAQDSLQSLRVLGGERALD